MNYQKIYDQIIKRTRNRMLNSYTERHHIIPKSMGGTDELTNIVNLTAKEHFVCHHLLWKTHRNREMTKAFMLMCNTKRNGVKHKISARTYTTLKEEFSAAQSEAVKSRPGNNLGKTLPQEWRDNISKGQKGHSRGKGRISNFKGMKHTEENKKKISERRKGIGTHFTPHSEETKAMMSANRKGKPKAPWTAERRAARSEMMRELHRKRKEEKSPD